MLASQLIDTHALLKVIWVSFVGAVGGTAAFSIAIAGAVRFVDLRRARRTMEAGVFATVAGVALLVCLAGVALGLYAIINKS
jgi:uncharacterized membrane protein